MDIVNSIKSLVILKYVESGKVPSRIYIGAKQKLELLSVLEGMSTKEVKYGLDNKFMGIPLQEVKEDDHLSVY